MLTRLRLLWCRLTAQDELDSEIAEKSERKKFYDELYKPENFRRT
jgi:hypothetical protein